MFAFLVTAARLAAPYALPVAGTLLTLVPTAAFLVRQLRRNPTIVAIEARQATQQAMVDAETRVEAAQELANNHKKEAEQERKRARACQEEADRAVARAVEEKRRMEIQLEEAAQAVKRAEELASEASKAAKEEAARLAQEAQEERERSQRIRENAEKVITAAMEEAGRVRKAADERRLEAEAGKALAEERARAAVEEAQRAIEAKADAERRLKEGIQPVVTPSPDQVATTQRRIQYKEGCCHFVVAGVSGSGKSSLVNAFRGLRSKDQGAAAVGVVETTRQLTRYADTDPNSPFIWYDAPGAGTLKCRDWQYFNEQGLYVFDSIIVIFDNRFTMTDIAILANATRFQIPTYIVRSKADQHIQNVMREMGYDENDSPERRHEVYWAARKLFIEETRTSVMSNLEDANLPHQRMYIVSSDVLLNIVLNRTPKKAIDELDLLNDLLSETYRRRKPAETADVGE